LLIFCLQANPEGRKKKRAQTRLTTNENQAMELGEDEFEDEDQAEQDGESFQSSCLGVEVAGGSTDLL
jgi:hypothetical protein